jgi:hypothetical protein
MSPSASPLLHLEARSSPNMPVFLAKEKLSIKRKNSTKRQLKRPFNKSYSLNDQSSPYYLFLIFGEVILGGRKK